MPEYMCQWINIKKIFEYVLGIPNNVRHFDMLEMLEGKYFYVLIY